MQVEVDRVERDWITAALGIDDLHLHQRDVGAVGLQALQRGNRGQPQRRRLASGLQQGVANALALGVVTDRFQFARLPSDGVEGKQEAFALASLPQQLAIQVKLDPLGARDDSDRLDDAGRVVPVADDMGARFFDIDPAVPHDLVGVVTVLRNSHGIDFAAAAIVLRAAVVGITVRENDVDAAGGDAGAGARTLAPVVEPAFHVLDRLGIRVAVIRTCVLAFVQWPLAFLVVGNCQLVPELAGRFVARVLHRPHRILRTLVYV